mmetsp:Transcript_11060/g.25320  ORF Transcript_11060/g.25320 Transcript_11060/m.25320 type:complete len:211 (+) Transcript_11060:298-930(+)
MGAQGIQQVLQETKARSVEFQGSSTANHTSWLLLVDEGVGVHPGLAHVHHVGLEHWATVRHDLQGLCGDGCCYDCVGGRNRWNDTLHHSHCQLVCHPGDTKGICTLLGLLIQPFHVVRRVRVDLHAWEALVPQHHQRILNAMFGQPGRLSNRTHWVVDLRRKGIERAIEARCHEGNDDPRLPLEALGSSIQQRYYSRHVWLARRSINHAM